MQYFFGEWKTSEHKMTLNEIENLLALGNQRIKEMAEYPTDRIFSVLSDLSELWANEEYEGRVQALAELPQKTGFSKEMTQLALNELPNLLNPKNLEKKLQTELRGLPPVGEEKYNFESQTGLAWQPLGMVLHVLASNVFLGGPGSWLEGLITKNVNILKMASGEKTFLPIFIRSLQQVDPDGVISRSVALIDFSSSESELIDHLKSSVDGIVVWGGEQAVKAYRRDLSLHTRLIAFGPKLSFSLITKSALNENSIESIAEDLASDISIWDQNACTAPQIIYVQDKNVISTLMKALGKTLAVKAITLPAGPPDLDTAVEIRKMRTIAEIASGRKQGDLSVSNDNLDYTVIVDYQTEIVPSPLHRTIKLIPIDSLNTVYTEMTKLKGFLQTVGLKSGLEEQIEIIQDLTHQGATRIVDLGSMAFSEIDDPHDGQYDLAQFVNIITYRIKNKKSLLPLDIYCSENFKKILDQRFRRLISQTQDKDLRIKIKGIEDIHQLPIMGINTPSHRPKEMKLPIGGYVTRSGGSTGEPKYSIYDGEDWERMISHAINVFHAMGLRRGDRVANCFMAGDLYGSFVSFDHINNKMGILSLGFAGQVTPEFFIETYKKVEFNVVQGVPAKILPLLREAKKMHSALKIEKVIYAGAPMSEKDRTWLNNELGTVRVASVIGANDGGQFAFQCKEQSGRFHHTVDDFNYIEIVDDQGMPINDDKPGRILITSLLKYNFPLIRYEIGDRARLVPTKCTCGSTRRVIEYLGRTDLISVGMMNFSFEDCHKILNEFEVSEIQIHIQSLDGKDQITINIESSNQSKDFGIELKKSLLINLGKLQERINEKALDLIINFVDIGTLPRDPRSGKIKQVIDERI